MPDGWSERIDQLDHAFQPIVNVHTGLCYGYEALLRQTERAGFRSIQDVFDAAFDDGVLAAVECALWARAIARFATLPHHRNTKLFCNADNRGALIDAVHLGRTVQVLAELGLSTASLCLEISERHNLNGHAAAAGIERDRQKRVLAETMVKLAHLLGRFVVAEGVETEAEFAVCRELGCDLVQGYLIQRPTLDIAELRERYDVVEQLVARDRRGREAAPDAISGQLIAAPTISSVASLSEALATIESFYDAPSRAAGGITANDRDGVTRRFPLMRVSAVALELHPGRPALSLDELSGLIAAGKRTAKRSVAGLDLLNITADGVTRGPTAPLPSPALASVAS